ncbi:MAG: hypothetical protein JKX72_05850 [Robiginitomaculum sp.]|nr:hypothetical protein [Robiginitomaculum sp.]
MTPDFEIKIDSTNLTHLIRDRLISLRISDETGFKSDQLSLVIDNRGAMIEVPRQGVTLTAAIGYKEEGLTHQGTYIVDEVATTLSPRTLTIKAKAADMTAGLKVKKTRSFEENTIGELVELVAGEHGLIPSVSEELSSIPLSTPPYKQFDQIDENDMHMLRRLAQQHDAVAMPKNGRLLFVKRGEVKAASGKPLGTITINEHKVSTARARAGERGKYKSVKAYYLDAGSQERVAVSTGEETPILVIRGTYGDSDTAERAVAAKLDALSRGKATLSLTGAGSPAMAAEHKLTFKTLDPLMGGDWIITRVEHEISASGFTTRIEAETPKEAK